VRIKTDKFEIELQPDELKTIVEFLHKPELAQQLPPMILDIWKTIQREKDLDTELNIIKESNKEKEKKEGKKLSLAKSNKSEDDDLEYFVGIPSTNQ
jgi:uncharacterized protein YhdP